MTWNNTLTPATSVRRLNCTPIHPLVCCNIPSHPFEVVSMDFILELYQFRTGTTTYLLSYKLTKWAIFIPCSTKITNVKIAELFFKHVICRYGIPSQIITVILIGRTHSEEKSVDLWEWSMLWPLPTTCRPTVRQKTSTKLWKLHIRPSRNDWTQYLEALGFSYNTTPHILSSFVPACLLLGCSPIMSFTLLSLSLTTCILDCWLGGEWWRYFIFGQLTGGARQKSSWHDQAGPGGKLMLLLNDKRYYPLISTWVV